MSFPHVILDYATVNGKPISVVELPTPGDTPQRLVARPQFFFRPQLKIIYPNANGLPLVMMMRIPGTTLSDFSLYIKTTLSNDLVLVPLEVWISIGNIDVNGELYLEMKVEGITRSKAIELFFALQRPELIVGRVVQLVVKNDKTFRETHLKAEKNIPNEVQTELISLRQHNNALIEEVKSLTVAKDIMTTSFMQQISMLHQKIASLYSHGLSLYQKLKELTGNTDEQLYEYGITAPTLDLTRSKLQHKLSEFNIHFSFYLTGNTSSTPAFSVRKSDKISIRITNLHPFPIFIVLFSQSADGKLTQLFPDIEDTKTLLDGPLKKLDAASVIDNVFPCLNVDNIEADLEPDSICTIDTFKLLVTDDYTLTNTISVTRSLHIKLKEGSENSNADDSAPPF